MLSRLNIDEARWSLVEAFCADSVGWNSDASNLLSRLKHFIGVLDTEILDCCPPEGFLDIKYAKIAGAILPTAIASNLVAARCERLALVEQLIYGWLSSMDSADLSVAALCSRSLIELGVDMYMAQGALENSFDLLLKDDPLIDDLNDPKGALLTELVRFRYAGRLDHQLWGAPKKTNVLTGVDKIGILARQAYDQLSEICHPNAQAGAQYWRRGRPFVSLAFRGGGESPIKQTALSGPCFAAAVVVPFSRSLWRMASIISLQFELWRTTYGARCGLPRPGSRNDPCVCGSGVKASNCDHPDPPLPPGPSGFDANID